MKQYKQAFDSIKVPEDMAERIKKKMAEETPAANESVESEKRKTVKTAAPITPFYRKIPKTAWNMAISGAAAAVIIVGVWITKPWLTPQPGLDDTVAVQTMTDTDAQTDLGEVEKIGGQGQAAIPDQTNTTGDEKDNIKDGNTGTENPDASGNDDEKKDGKDQTKKDPKKEDGNTSLGTENPGGGNTGAGDSVFYQEAQSEQELISLLDFVPELPETIPDTAKVLSYIAVDSNMAEINYKDQETTICYRTGVTAEEGTDISGDYNEYPRVQVTDDKYTVKGSESQTAVVIWTAEDKSYSLSFSPEVSDQVAIDWAQAVGISR